jgi:hypothetical protein
LNATTSEKKNIVREEPSYDVVAAKEKNAYVGFAQHIKNKESDFEEEEEKKPSSSGYSVHEYKTEEYETDDYSSDVYEFKSEYNV